jgi:CBS domain-containing protein
MTTTVITVRPDTTVQEAARLLLSNGISVDDSATLVGIISEGDLLRRAHEGAWPKAWGPPPRRGWARWLMDTEISEAEYFTQHDVRVADIMTREIVQAQPESSLSDVAALMLSHRIKRVPVVRNGQVVGIVSRQDIVKVLAGLPK